MTTLESSPRVPGRRPLLTTPPVRVVGVVAVMLLPASGGGSSGHGLLRD